uniref:Uncharacterized protein n=1 Tax=Arundo donax TaxID=35708 RepID=A0A0A9GT32_ARUDO
MQEPRRLRLLLLVSHENRNAELSGEELVGVASPAGGTAMWVTSAATALSNTPVESASGSRR